MYLSEKAFRNCRVRYQRLSDAKFGSGWVRSFSDSEVRIRTHRDEPSPEKEQCFLEVYGDERDALVVARAERMSPSHDGCPQYRFVPTSKVSYRSALGEGRYMVEGIAGAVMADGGFYEITVLDISSRGIAVFGRQSFKSGEAVGIHVMTPSGEMNFDAQVRYSRADRRAAGFYRTGLEMTSHDRVNLARWRSFNSDLRAA